MYVNINIRRL